MFQKKQAGLVGGSVGEQCAGGGGGCRKARICNWGFKPRLPLQLIWTKADFPYPTTGLLKAGVVPALSLPHTQKQHPFATSAPLHSHIAVHTPHFYACCSPKPIPLKSAVIHPPTHLPVLPLPRPLPLLPSSWQYTRSPLSEVTVM